MASISWYETAKPDPDPCPRCGRSKVVYTPIEPPSGAGLLRFRHRCGSCRKEWERPAKDLIEGGYFDATTMAIPGAAERLQEEIYAKNRKHLEFLESSGLGTDHWWASFAKRYS